MTARRQLIVMRHAKSGELPGGPDAERALRPRGIKNATAAGQWLASRGPIPDLVLCSPARRARQTWQYVSAELTGEPAVSNDHRLYEADADRLIEVFAETDPAVRTLMYVGHNPAAADVTEALTGRPAGFPTAAIAIVGLELAWADLSPGAGCPGELVATWAPQPES
jgi:phosphohistidine phosphatase